MEKFEQVVRNIYTMLNGTQYSDKSHWFISATEEDMKKLHSLFKEAKMDEVYKFYKCYQPYDIPMLKSYVNLLSVDDIVSENTDGEPGKYLAEYGVYTIATTVGGNIICLDANDISCGEPSVLIADSNFCSYNDYFDCIEIGIAPEEVVESLKEDELLSLSYDNIKKCLPKIADTFSEFLYNLSINYYGNIEEKYLNI